MIKIRAELISDQFHGLPAFRLKQMEAALFQDGLTGWKDVSTLPLAMREALEIPWMSFAKSQVFWSEKKDTAKAILTLEDGQEVESVLMENRRGQWTICVSSQVGCAMACTFCATGKMGFARNLTQDEIVDQYRFWKSYLKDHPELPDRISNVVFMGMGEPMANYENVKATLQTWLRHTDLGLTHITVSTVGLLPVLAKLLEDPDWPRVRIALSLHSADNQTRKDIVPTSHDQFLPQFENWCREYLRRSGNRRHHLTFEYVMLQDVNDTPMHAKKLADLVNRLGHVRVNLIPYNFTDLGFQRSIHERTQAFKEILESAGVTATIRKTMGDDIAAACGQLITIGAKE
jgi:23S rRNA (adenine2503-C2)-methyltransferase